MVLGNGIKDVLQEVTTVDGKIKDYFSPQGNFPDGMYMAKELRAKTYQIPEGYTEEECMELLMAITCSDICMEDTIVSGSSAANYMVDPRQNGIVKQIAMMMTNSVLMDDFDRQKGVSQAYGRGRDILPEVLRQLAQNDPSGARRLVSQGVRNLMQVQKNIYRVVQAKQEDYSVNRVMEMAVHFLEQHPELRDPEILTDQDMEEIQIFHGRMAFLKEVQEKGRQYGEKLKNGEALTEDEIAEVILLNQINAVSEKEERDRKSEIYAEFLKQEKLPGGLEMPIGQKVEGLQGGLRNYDNANISLGQFMGPGEYERYKLDLQTRANEAVVGQGYGDFTKAVILKYPENREFLLEQVKKSTYFQEMRTKKGNDLVRALETSENKGVFTKEITGKLLEQEGLQENPVTYHVETIPENRKYAEALEAAKRGEDIYSEEWEKRFFKMAEKDAEAVERNLKKNEKARKYDTLSVRLGERLRGSREKWCTKLTSNKDALTELLTNGQNNVFVLNENGDREYLVADPDGSNLEQMKEKCLEAETNGIFITAPADAETKTEIMAVRLDMEANNNECEMTPLKDYIRNLEEIQVPEKPSLWKRIFAFLVPSYREEIAAYEAAVKDNENAVNLKTAGSRVHSERLAAREVTNINVKKDSETAEKIVDLEENLNEKMDKLEDDFEIENQKNMEMLDPDKCCENLQNWIKRTTGDTVEPETAILAFINSMQPSEDSMESYQNRHYMEQILTNGQALGEEEIEKLKWGYVDMRDRAQRNEKLISSDKLKCFQNALMYPDTAVTAFGVGASLMNKLGEAGIKRALKIDKDRKLTPETMGIMEYGKIAQESAKICAQEAERAKTEPKKELSVEDVLTVLITDSIDRERAMNRAVTSTQNGLLTTTMIRYLGKKGMEDYRKEIRNAVGDDYLKEQAAKGSKEFVENHRNTLGLLEGKSLSKRIGGHSRQKATTNLENIANSLK